MSWEIDHLKQLVANLQAGQPVPGLAEWLACLQLARRSPTAPPTLRFRC